MALELSLADEAAWLPRLDQERATDIQFDWADDVEPKSALATAELATSASAVETE